VTTGRVIQFHEGYQGNPSFLDLKPQSSISIDRGKAGEGEEILHSSAQTMLKMIVLQIKVYSNLTQWVLLRMFSPVEGYSSKPAK